MIDRTHSLSVSRQAELLNISRGAVYYLPKPTSERDLTLMNAIDKPTRGGTVSRGSGTDLYRQETRRLLRI